MSIRTMFRQAGTASQCLTLAATSVLFAGLASAQEGSPFTFDVGGGFTNTVGHTSRELNDGWNVTGGVGMNFSRWIGAKIDVAYNRLLAIIRKRIFLNMRPGGQGEPLKFEAKVVEVAVGQGLLL